jgi:hypothetical protein
MTKGNMWLAVAALALAAPVAAQDNSNIQGEVVVTAQRASAGYLADVQPVVGLRRTADSAIQRVQFTSDSREEDVRKREIHAMLERSAAPRVPGSSWSPAISS